MALGKNWSEWWRRFLDLSTNESCTVVDILRERFVGEMQQADRLKQYARRMHYPQYQGKLLQLATEKSKQAQWIAEKIAALGGKLPEASECRSTDENSWRSLSMALDEESRSADHLEEQLRSIQSEHADIAQFLQQISQEQQNHRVAIRDMLMRSDPFALSLA